MSIVVSGPFLFPHLLSGAPQTNFPFFIDLSKIWATGKAWLEHAEQSTEFFGKARTDQRSASQPVPKARKDSLQRCRNKTPKRRRLP
jgi:hypothetical protein